MVWDVTLKDEEWKNIKIWHTDPTSKLSTKDSFFDWDTEKPTSDRSKGCAASKGGKTLCYIYTPAGANAGWIGGEGSTGFAAGTLPEVSYL